MWDVRRPTFAQLTLNFSTESRQAVDFKNEMQQI